MNFVARFEQEAKAMAKLDHPAIISVFDFGETSEGQLYFVMEFVEGMDIHQYLNHHGGRLNQDDALAIIAHVLDALEYAHSHGIVHRDIKPANILLNNEGRVKVADFGLAKKLSAGEDDGPALTMSNVAIGTPDYVAPEALEEGSTPDHRADLYAIGVMLYRMLTGKLPRGQFKLPSEIVPNLDPRLDEIVNLSLQPNPEDRYASASSVRSALDPIFTTPLTKVEGMEQKPTSGGVQVAASRHEPTKSKAKMPLVIGAIAVLAVGGVVAFLMKGGSEPEKLPAVAKVEPQQEPKVEPKAKGKPKPKEAPEPKVAEARPAQPVETPEAPEPSTPEPKKMVKAEAAEPNPEITAPAKELSAGETEESESWSQRLAGIPGLDKRLSGYFQAHRSGIGTLAASYLRGLDGRLNQAADSGDLPLVKAYRAEKKAVEALRESYAESPTDLIAAVEGNSSLPALPANAPKGLQSLRTTWTQEQQKIRDDLDGKLALSLTALVTELTKAREFDQAESIMAFRESLADENEPDPPMKVASTEAAPEAEAEGSGGQPAEASEETEAMASGSPGVPGQGRLKVFGNFRNGKPMDLSAAEGITDFIEVHCTPAFFVALRATGEVVSNSPIIPAVQPMRIKKIFPGFVSKYDTKNFLGLTEHGDLISLSTKNHLAGLPKMDSPVVDVIVKSEGLLILLEDGTLRWWGSMYEAQGGKNLAPPVEARTGIKAIAASSTLGPGAGWIAVLTEQGKVVSWTSEGERELPDQYGSGVVMISNVGADLIALNQGGLVLGIGNRDSGNQRGKVELRPSAGGTAFVIRAEDGKWHLASGERKRYPLINEGMSHLSNQGSRQFDVVISSRESVDGLIWIEPVDTDSATTPPPETSSPESAPVKDKATASPAAGSVTSKATKESPFVNSLKMKFVPVPITGGPTDGHKVLFSVWETRVSDFLEYVDDNEKTTGWRIDRENENEMNVPVGNVSQLGAVNFCEWLTRRERDAGLIGPNERYRLPSDHEWSCAVGIGHREDASRSPVEKSRRGVTFPWGGGWPPGEGDGNYKGIGEGTGNKNADKKEPPIPGYSDGFKDTAPVGSFRENEYGLFDLGGNLSEWCADELEGEGGPQVLLRGGSYQSAYNTRIRSSARRLSKSNTKSLTNGFRCVLVSE